MLQMPAVEGNDVEAAGCVFRDTVLQTEIVRDLGNGALFGKRDGFCRKPGDFGMTVFDFDKDKGGAGEGNEVDFPEFASVVLLQNPAAGFRQMLCSQGFIDRAQASFVFRHGKTLRQEDA